GITGCPAMSPYESRTYPFPLKRYLESTTRAPSAFTLKSKRFYGTKSATQKRSKIRSKQLEMNLTTQSLSNHQPGHNHHMANNNPPFESIPDPPAADIERPKPLPAGTYDAVVRGLPEYGES